MELVWPLAVLMRVLLCGMLWRRASSSPSQVVCIYMYIIYIRLSYIYVCVCVFVCVCVCVCVYVYIHTYIYHAHTHTNTHTGHGSGLTAANIKLAISPDGRSLVSASGSLEDTNLKVWCVDTGACRGILRGREKVSPMMM
jgi:hypothetical protein